MLRINDEGERVPLTIADYDREKGIVSIIFQLVGKTTQALAEMNEGDSILDFVGPLGVASHHEGYKKSRCHRRRLGYSDCLPTGQSTVPAWCILEICRSDHCVSRNI